MALAILPDEMSVGATVEWEYQETPIQYYGGQVQVARDWPFPKAVATFQTPVLDNSGYKTFLDLYETHGRSMPFLVKLRSRYSLTDEPMGGTADGLNKTFILQESIAVGDETVTRFIDYPIGTPVVEDDGVPVTVDTVTKRSVLLVAAPAAASVMTFTTEFYRLMRFRDPVRAAVGNHENSGQIQSVTIVEDFEFT